MNLSRSLRADGMLRHKQLSIVRAPIKKPRGESNHVIRFRAKPPRKEWQRGGQRAIARLIAETFLGKTDPALMDNGSEFCGAFDRCPQQALRRRRTYP